MTIQDMEINFGPFLLNEFGDRYLYDVNRNTFNSVGSETLYQNHFGDRFLKPNQLNIFVGTDSGLLLDYLRKKTLPKGSRYVFVEIPEIISLLKKAEMFDDLPDQISVLSHDDLWERESEFQFENYAYILGIYYFEAFCTSDGYMQFYQELAVTVAAELTNKYWAVTAGTGLSSFINRQFQNLCENRTDATIVKNRFHGKTAIVLGGGPSLDDLLPWVRENSDKVVIFAVSRICRQLFSAGVVPHIICSVDPHDLSFDISKEMFHFADQSIFICSNHVSQLLLGQWRGLSIFLGSLFPWETSLNTENFSGGGPTVTNTALLTAVYMGFSQVIFGGVDFCFSPSGITHASGSDESAAGPQLGNSITVKTNDGRVADSSPDFICGMQTMDEQANYAVSQGCRVINPAGHAARLENVEYLPLKDIQVDPPDCRPAKELKSLIVADDSLARRVHYQKVLKELHRVERRMSKIQKLVNEALKCNDGLFGRKGLKRDFKYKLRMDTIEVQLKRDFADLYPLVRRYSLRNLLRIAMPDSQEDWSDEEVERIGRDYYQACLSSVKGLLQHVRNAILRTEMRLEEEKDSPDFNRLTEYWRAQKHLGRIRVWKSQHPEQWLQFSIKERERLLVLDQEFEAILQETDTLNLKKRKHDAGLHKVASTALKYFNTDDKEGLLRLEKGLAEHPDTPKSEPLALFVAGLQDELEDKPEQAIEKYYQLIGDIPTFLTEDTLLRILTISLSKIDLDNAQLAAQCLSGLSVIYLPHFAKILHLKGDKAAALDAYADYLEKVGYDISVMLKMGRLYLELEITDGAKLMFESVLEQNSTNNAALHLLSTLNEENS